VCGIVGILAVDGTVDPAVLQQMNDRLAHRGPDGEGFMLASGRSGDLRPSFHRRVDTARCDGSVRVGLGHRRLAILDLSDRGMQPMRTEDERHWIVFNGEIYNHREIRSLLES
jgi:asparagine synthase (glutamine-hydrolysing)